MKIDYVREIAIKILYKIEQEAGYSNIVLNEYFDSNKEKLTIRDKNFISELVYGTISWKFTIDAIIEKYSKTKLKKISKWILLILEAGVYQIVFLDKVPKSAAVNESVNLCKKYGFQSANFVNAILRKVEKSDYEEFKQIQNPITRFSKMYSMPEWIVERLFNSYDLQTVEKICKNSNIKPKMTIRINTLKITKEQFVQKLNERNIQYEESENDNFLYIQGINDVSNLDLFKDGFFIIQDIGAGKIAEMLSPKENDKVLDACSAPGGKTTYLAELMKNTGEIIALDLYSHRIKLIEENAKRLGITCIKTEVKDATLFDEKLTNKFDKILLDVPCLGLGVMKRKPDIKLQRKEEDIEEIKRIQFEILKTCSKYLKVGGELVYSTCSILKEENEEQIEKLMKLENINGEVKFVKKAEKNIIPDENEDGFYICKIEKIK